MDPFRFAGAVMDTRALRTAARRYVCLNRTFPFHRLGTSRKVPFPPCSAGAARLCRARRCNVYECPPPPPRQPLLQRGVNDLSNQERQMWQ